MPQKQLDHACRKSSLAFTKGFRSTSHICEPRCYETTTVPTIKLDADVTGAGPVGFAMASELARYGLRVRIVDKAAECTDESKALVIWSRTLEHMDSVGASAALLAAGRTCDAATYGLEQKRSRTFPSMPSIRRIPTA